MRRFIWPIGTVSLAALASAVVALGADQSTTTTYRWVDAQGVVHYSDTPQAGAQQLKIHPAQTYRSPEMSSTVSGRALETQGGKVYQSCSVLHPAPEQSLYAPEQVDVSLNLRPTLRSGDQISVTLDGAPLSPLDDASLHYRISDPDRGTHTLSVTVHDASGNIVCNSSGITFYVERPSRLSPQSPARRH